MPYASALVLAQVPRARWVHGVPQTLPRKPQHTLGKIEGNGAVLLSCSQYLFLLPCSRHMHTRVHTLHMHHAGWVRTRMTNDNGLITAQESVTGMLAVLEGGLPLEGCPWYDFAGKVIPW